MKLNEVKKKKAVEHIVYEIMMFEGTTLKLLSNFQDQFETNILVESFTIHSRNLFDFFYEKKGRKDDISADDFLVKKKEFIVRRTKKRILKNLTKKTDKQIAHLTYSRNNYKVSTKGWNIEKIHNNMNKTIVAFYTCLDPPQKEWFKDYYKKFNLLS